MMDGDALAARYARTGAGRAEIQQRVLPLSRAGRNLLLTIDTSRSGEDWLVRVRGATEDDLHMLIQAGLVAAPGMAQAAPPATPRVAQQPAAPRQAQQPGAPRMSLAQALQTKSFEVLCRRVLAEARPRLGRVRGYMLVVESEYCANADDVRALALKFVEQVRERDGDRAAIDLAQTLIAPD
ncbi:MAG: hypothetical protein QE285_08035 [Aquabacterium sp.]|nr:hypothetical protein [Aquabacterium sp.]